MRRRRFWWLSLTDTAAWLLAYCAYTVIRYSLSTGSVSEALGLVNWQPVMVAGLLASLLHVFFGLFMRLHHGRASIGSLDETISLSVVVATVGVATTTANLLGGRFVPGTVPIVAAFMALTFMAWSRAAYRAGQDHLIFGGPDAAEPAASRRVVVLGAGDAGSQLVATMLKHRSAGLVPVALLDDDPMRRHRRVRGIPVVGGHRDVAAAALKAGATVCVIAIPSADSERIRELSAPALEAGLEVKVLPTPEQLLQRGKVAIADIRDIDVTDLLGRHQIDTDIESIADYVTGKRVLVTGAGGSIGSELCRQIAKFAPDELIMLDRDESALHAVQLSIYGRALLDSDDVVLGDIRDSLFIDALFEERRPHVVFHAAALKHLPMLEQYPGEAVKTNVWGTLSILEAAKAHKVERFVNISTDKAANPCSVLGYSKRLAEGLTASVAREAEGTFLSVRFGNVLGSRGSVLTAFAAQIANGGPVTVTDPDVTRYFMTVQEAVQLVIQAAAIGRDGEALVLDMGEPVSIDAVARQLIEVSGKDVEVVYTGLRAGEKMHEELWGDGEPDLRPTHHLVSHTPVTPFSALAAREMDPWSEDSMVILSLQAAAARMAPSVVAQRVALHDSQSVVAPDSGARMTHASHASHAG